MPAATIYEISIENDQMIWIGVFSHWDKLPWTRTAN